VKELASAEMASAVEQLKQVKQSEAFKSATSRIAELHNESNALRMVGNKQTTASAGHLFQGPMFRGVGSDDELPDDADVAMAEEQMENAVGQMRVG
jgi:hypothetical protein